TARASSGRGPGGETDATRSPAADRRARTPPTPPRTERRSPGSGPAPPGAAAERLAETATAGSRGERRGDLEFASVAARENRPRRSRRSSRCPGAQAPCPTTNCPNARTFVLAPHAHRPRPRRTRRIAASDAGACWRFWIAQPLRVPLQLGTFDLHGRQLE